MVKKLFGALIVACAVAGLGFSANAASLGRQEMQTTMQGDTMMSSKNATKTKIKRKKATKRRVKKSGGKPRKS